MMIRNKDWENWKEIMAVEPGPLPSEKVVTRPRPGHADLVGAIQIQIGRFHNPAC